MISKLGQFDDQEIMSIYLNVHTGKPQYHYIIKYNNSDEPN